jgi:acetyl-CoA acetyltransferase
MECRLTPLLGQPDHVRCGSRYRYLQHIDRSHTSNTIKAGVEHTFGSFPRDRMNPNGGSVALGHPFAATGARILSQAVKELAAKPKGARNRQYLRRRRLGHCCLVGKLNMPSIGVQWSR